MRRVCLFVQSGARVGISPVVDEETEEEVPRHDLLGTLLSTVYIAHNKHPTNKYQPLTMVSKPANEPSVSPDINTAKSGCKHAASNKHYRPSDTVRRRKGH